MEQRKITIALLCISLAGCGEWFVRKDAYDVNVDTVLMSDCENLPSLDAKDDSITGVLYNHVEVRRLYDICADKNKAKGQVIKGLENGKIIRITPSTSKSGLLGTKETR